MLKRIALLLTTLAAFAPAILTPSARAEAAGTISVTPAVVMLRGVAGQSTTQRMTVTNASREPFTFELIANDVLVRDGQRRFSPAGAEAGSIAATAAFSEKRITVAPGDSKQVDVTLTIPDKPAGRAVVALFHGTNKIHTAGMNMTGSVGTLLTFALSDNVAMRADALAVQAPTASSNLTIAQHCVNSGSEPLLAKGMLAILGANGAMIGKSALPARRLLPGETTDMRAEYGGELAAGHYRALVTYDIGGQVVSSSAEFDVR
jgi:hypothetical protein